VHALQQQNK